MLKKILIKTDDIIARIERVIIIISVLVMIFLSFSQIILRIFFHSGISWADTFLRHLVMISALFSASLVSYYQNHFRVEIIDKINIKSNKIKNVIQLFSIIFTVSVILLILYSTYNFITLEFGLSEVLENIKKFKFETDYLILLLPIIFINMFFHTSVSLFKYKDKNTHGLM